MKLQRPITIKLAPKVDEYPPEIPKDRSVLKVIWWSLRIRLWAILSDTFEGPSPNIKIFVVFHDPKKHDVLNNSFGLEKGHLGLANAFADPRQREQNNLVITHELLHTLGATDKYNLETFQSTYPEGYAEPNKAPLLPQGKAEIMGDRIPISASESVIPDRFLESLIGEKTAREIHWID